MQTFLPYSNFTITAKVLDRQRLGKQRVECLQILRTLSKGPQICTECGDSFSYGCCGGYGLPKTTPWYNHPAVQMWKGYESALLLYLREICNEWTNRGYQDTCYEKAKHYTSDIEIILLPNWVGNTTFHMSHQSNLLRKNPEYYGEFFLNVPDDLPYYWPTKH
jgi:hypothetical protein